MTQLAFPDNQKLPSDEAEGPLLSLIAKPIRFKLRQPEIQTCLWQTSKLATLASMPVPKAAMNENRLVSAGENEIGLTWQVCPMQAISKAH
jgi:hypothetical protein